MSPRERNGGFTLIELLVVVAIGVILAAVGLPGFIRAMRSYKIQGAAKQVAGDLQTARSKAVMTNTNRGVSLVIVDSDSYRFVYEDRTKTDDTPLGPLQDLPQGVHFVQNTVDGKASSIRFQQLGGFCNTTPDTVATGKCTRAGVQILCPADEGKLCACEDKDKSGKRCDGTERYFFGLDGPTTGGVDGGLYVQLREETTGLVRQVHVAPGGRVRAGVGQTD